MAILKNGLISGKAGDTIFRVCNGQVVVTARNGKMTNPRSQGQQAQRIKQRNITRFYSMANAVMALRDNFEGKVGKQSDYTRFISLNLHQKSVLLTRKEGEQGACVAAPYIASQGCLPSIETILMGKEGTSADNTARADLRFVSTIFLGEIAVNESTTVAEISHAIISNNEAWEQGDELRYIACVQENTSGYPCVSFSVQSLILDVNDNTPLSKEQSICFSNISGFLGNNAVLPEGAFVWVHHRQKGKSHYCSSQQFVVLNTLYDQYSNEDAMKRALDSWK